MAMFVLNALGSLADGFIMPYAFEKLCINFGQIGRFQKSTIFFEDFTEFSTYLKKIYCT